MGMASTFAQILSKQTLKSKQSPPLATTVSLRQVFELLNCVSDNHWRWVVGLDCHVVLLRESQTPRRIRTLVLGRIGKFDPCGRPMPVFRMEMRSPNIHFSHLSAYYEL